MQKMFCVFCLALAKAGSSSPARMAMMAITTRSSIKVNPSRRSFFAAEMHLVLGLGVFIRVRQLTEQRSFEPHVQAWRKISPTQPCRQLCVLTHTRHGFGRTTTESEFVADGA